MSFLLPSIAVVADALKTLDPNQFGKWTHYLTLKASFYESYVSLYSEVWLQIYLAPGNRHTVFMAKSSWSRKSVGTPLKLCSTVKLVSREGKECQFFY